MKNTRENEKVPNRRRQEIKGIDSLEGRYQKMENGSKRKRNKTNKNKKYRVNKWSINVFLQHNQQR